MKKTIKLAYDWYGPDFPLTNNQSSFIDAVARARTITPEERNSTIQNTLLPYRSLTIFKDIEGYEYVPSAFIKDNDYFIYELTTEMNETNWLDNPSIDIFKYTHISDFLLEQIRKKNGYILIEVSHESPAMFMFFDNINAYFNARNIPLNKVILLTGSINISEIYKKYCNHFQITGRERMTVHGYEWYEYMASKDINELESIPKPNDNFYKIQRTFLCYNRRFKPHRTDLYVLFFKHGLLNNTYYSMPAISDTYDNTTFKENYKKEELSTFEDIVKTKQWFRDTYKLDDEEEFNHINGKLPLVVDTRRTLKEMIKLVDPAESLYDSSLVSIVTESNFYSNDIFNTEKTWKAVANCHPFILVGPYKSLEYLKSLGYKTFSDFWDEDYDNIENPLLRLLEITHLCQKINEWDWHAKNNFFNEVTKVTDYNFKLLKSIYTENKRNQFWETFRDWHLK